MHTCMELVRNKNDISDFNRQSLSIAEIPEKEGFMSCKDPEDEQLPRALYDINPDFQSI